MRSLIEGPEIPCAVAVAAAAAAAAAAWLGCLGAVSRFTSRIC